MVKFTINKDLFIENYIQMFKPRTRSKGTLLAVILFVAGLLIGCICRVA